MPEGPAAPEVLCAEALITEPSNASNITECTGFVGAESGNKAVECKGAAGGCFDLSISYTLPEPGMVSSKQRTPPFPGVEDKSCKAVAVFPENINFEKDCATLSHL